MSELFSPDFIFHNAILGGVGVALLCSLLGIYLVLRRLVLIGVALPQASAAGIAAVFWLTGHGHAGAAATHWLALAGSLGATFVALALLVLGQRRSRSPAEWGVGALFALSSAATILFVAINPKGDIEMAGLLRGELLAITSDDLHLLGGVLLAVSSLFFLFRRDLLLTSFDPEFARTLGRDPLRYDLLLYLLIGGGVALGVMTAGPLVVFGFLVLPALTALRVAPGLVAAFAIAAAVAVGSFLGGFWVAYRADLPAGPACVALAGVCWAAANLWMRLRARRVAAASLVLALLLLAGGCASRFEAAAQRASGPLPRGSLPESLVAQPIAVLPFSNATGQTLTIPEGFFDDVLRFANGAPAERRYNVPDALQQRAAFELERRGFQAKLVAPEERRSVLAGPSVAAPAGASGPALTGVLRRFTLTGSGLLLVQLDLALVTLPQRDVLWTGSATRPVSIPSALTWQEILLDAGPPIFADAFDAR